MATIINPDGTPTPAHDQNTTMGKVGEAKPPFSDADPAQAIGSFFAAQIALYRLLRGLRVEIGSYENLLAGTGSYTPSKSIRLTEVYIDSPDSENDIKPLHATILETAPQTIDDDHGPSMVYGIDGKPRFWHGFPLRCIGKMQGRLGVVAWFGHKNERRAFRVALQRSLMAEQRGERGGRIITVPEYFCTDVRLMFVDATNIDQDNEGGLSEHRTLQVTVAYTTDEIIAVGAPPLISATFRPEVGAEVQP